MGRLSRVSVVVILCALATPMNADDWPQWMGPERDNVWRESNIISRFPKGGPKILWRSSIAGGYAGPAVAGGRVYVTDFRTSDDVSVANFDRRVSKGMERLHCLDEVTGKRIWNYEYPATYSISYPSGPRCTPVVHRGKVYSLGAEGHLACHRVDGSFVWSKELAQLYGTKAALWGYAAHPLIDGNNLITLVGGSGSHVVAFDKDSGEEVWRSLTSPEQGYSPPTIMKFGERRLLVLLRPDAVTAVNPETGKEIWSVPYEASNGSIIMSPVRSGNLMFLGGFSNKNLLIRVSDDGLEVEVEWRNLRRQAISPINVQPFVDKGMMYGFDQTGYLMGIEFTTGKRVWQSGAPFQVERPAGNSTAFIVKHGERYWLFSDEGYLIIAELSREGYHEIDRAKVIETSNTAFGRDVVWSVPAFANRHAYIRNDSEIISVDLGR